MDERDSQIQRDVDTDIDLDSTEGELGVDASTADIGLDSSSGVGAGPQATTEESEESRLEKYLGFSTPNFLIALLVSIVGLILVGGIPLLGILGNFLGIAAGTFLFGTVSSKGRYLESGLAGGITGAGAVVLSYLFLSLMGTGSFMLLFGLVGGGASGLLGHYFGRDLRDGLTREL
jgi:hypothetical protein